MPEGVTDPDYRPLPGQLGNMTMVQVHALETLKKQLQAEGKFVEARMDDAALLRFLRARKFDVAKAKEMLLDAEQWRIDFKVDDLVQNFEFKEKAEVNKYYPQFYHKTDRDGRPIYIEQLGKLDIPALYSCTTPERQLQRLVHEYERSLLHRLPACSRDSGHPVETYCTILDLGNISISSFYRVKDYVMQASSVGQNRYPETMGKFFIINVPWTFSAVWSIIKPWLDEVTVKKINILSGAYRDELLKQIPIENLPKQFGGECDCPEGCSMSDAGPWKQQA